MKPGPRKQPTALAVVKGNVRTLRERAKEPVPPTARPEAPADLSDVSKAEWRRVVDQLADLGLMTNLDVAVLTAYCDAFGEWTSARKVFGTMRELSKGTGGFMVKTPNGGVQIAPLVSIIRGSRSDMVRFAAEMGMTPAARAGMEIDVGTQAPKSQADPAERFFR